MTRYPTITLLRSAILATAMACGAIGVKWHRTDSASAALELLDYADTISWQIAEADELEQRLLAEGRHEETYRVYDIRRNTERDWIDIKETLGDYLGFRNRRRLLTHDILTEPEAIRAATAEVRLHLDDRAGEYVMLGASAILLLVTLVIRPPRQPDKAIAVATTEVA